MYVELVIHILNYYHYWEGEEYKKQNSLTMQTIFGNFDTLVTTFNGAIF